MKLVLCANHRAGNEALKIILNKDIVDKESLLVFTHERKENEKLIKFCKEASIEVIFSHINHCYQVIIDFEPDIIFSCYYRYIINKNILLLASKRSFNCHPSLLPNYRGAMSTPWMIINREKYAGVTFHDMDEKIDNGKIILQKKIKIKNDDTAFSLYHKIVSEAIRRIPEVFDLINEDYPGIDQADPLPNKKYYSRALPFNGLIDCNVSSMDDVINFARAMHFPPFPGAKIKRVDGKIMEIVEFDDILKINQSYFI